MKGVNVIDNKVGTKRYLLSVFTLQFDSAVQFVDIVFISVFFFTLRYQNCVRCSILALHNAYIVCIS